jgi:hypothetical protein
LERRDKVDNARLQVLLECTVHLSDALKNLFTVYHGFIWEFLISELSSVPVAAGKRRKGGASHSNLARVCRVVELCAVHDRDSFITDEKFEQAVVGLVAVLKSEVGTLQSAATPALTELFAGTFDEMLWKGGVYKLLVLTKGEATEALKTIVLQTLYNIIGRIGGPSGCLIPDLMPFLVEALEDVSDTVTDLAVQNYRQLERLTGQELKDYLRS